jgi:hypothetical protein
VPRVVSLGELQEHAGELVKTVATSREAVVIEDGRRAVAVLAPGSAVAAVGAGVDLPEWTDWTEQVRASFPDATAGTVPASAKAEREVDKELLGFDPAAGAVGTAGGREFLRNALQQLGVPVGDDDLLAAIYSAVIELCEEKARIFEEDLRVIAHEAIAEAPQRLKLLSMTVQCTSGVPAMAEVTLELSHGPAMRRAHGDGPLHAAFTAIEKLVGVEPEVENFSVVSATRGPDALAEATIQIAADGLSVAGRGASTDAIEAGVLAYLNALNFLLEARRGEVAAPQADS